MANRNDTGVRWTKSTVAMPLCIYSKEPRYEMIGKAWASRLAGETLAVDIGKWFREVWEIQIILFDLMTAAVYGIWIDVGTELSSTVCVCVVSFKRKNRSSNGNSEEGTICIVGGWHIGARPMQTPLFVRLLHGDASWISVLIHEWVKHSLSIMRVSNKVMKGRSIAQMANNSMMLYGWLCTRTLRM